jgi:hypothetical protein
MSISSGGTQFGSLLYICHGSLTKMLRSLLVATGLIRISAGTLFTSLRFWYLLYSLLIGRNPFFDIFRILPLLPPQYYSNEEKWQFKMAI